MFSTVLDILNIFMGVCMLDIDVAICMHAYVQTHPCEHVCMYA